MELYYRTINQKTLQSKMSSNLKTDVDVFVPTLKDVEIFEMISMIIRKNLPVGIVEDEDYR